MIFSCRNNRYNYNVFEFNEVSNEAYVIMKTILHKNNLCELVNSIQILKEIDVNIEYNTKIKIDNFIPSLNMWNDDNRVLSIEKTMDFLYAQHNVSNDLFEGVQLQKFLDTVFRVDEAYLLK